MNNSDTFLKTFSTVEKWLRRTANNNQYISFSKLVDSVAKTNPSVFRYSDDLKEYASLRNAIVHERTDDHVIAEPNATAVAHFEHICGDLLNPPTVIPAFQRSVKTLTSEDSVGEAVTIMRQGSFSQLPILSDGAVKDLLTAETVARWLASEVASERAGSWETKIELLLQHSEDQDHYCFLAGGATLIDALARFDGFVAKGKDLDAILLTRDGRADQTLIGILTIYDVPEILSAAGLKRLSAR